MPWRMLVQAVLLPELKLLEVVHSTAERRFELSVEKKSEMEVCPKCATPSRATYDRRTVTVKDEPLRTRHVVLRIRKRRFSCKPCGKPFMEPVAGIKKGFRTTERFQKAILHACERYADLKKVRQRFRCSAGYVYKVHNEKLALRLSHRQKTWPKFVGIDEHAFKRNKKLGVMEFATILTDLGRPRIVELVDGRTTAAVEAATRGFDGRENVRFVVMDMCDTFRSFARQNLPQAQIVADKFHVLRLLNPAINRERKAITGDKRTLRVRKLLLRSRWKLEPIERHVLDRWLQNHPTLREIYSYKEILHQLYRTKGHRRAARALTNITDAMASSQVPDIQRLRRTLMRWRDPILNHFKSRLTNARTEGFNNLAKVIKRRAYGYRNFENYRLRVLNAAY